jgi:hypothetical protein
VFAQPTSGLGKESSDNMDDYGECQMDWVMRPLLAIVHLEISRISLARMGFTGM